MVRGVVWGSGNRRNEGGRGMSKKKRKYSIEEINSWFNAFSLSGYEKFLFPREVTPKDVAELAVQFLKRVEPDSSIQAYRSDDLGTIGKASICAYEDACSSATHLLRQARVAIEREHHKDTRYSQIAREEWATSEMWKAFSVKVKELEDQGTVTLGKKENWEMVRKQKIKKGDTHWNPCFPISRAALIKLAGLTGGQTTEKILEVLRYRIKEIGGANQTSEEIELEAQRQNEELKEKGIYESDFTWFILQWSEIGDLMCDLRENAKKDYKSI